MDVLNFIGGRFIAAKSAKTLENFSPADGKTIGSLPLSAAEDVEAAVVSAKNAFQLWKNFSLEEKSKKLNVLASLIERDLKELSRLESLDTGKPLSLCEKVDIPRAASNFRFFASYLYNVKGESFFNEKEQNLHVVQKAPLGVVGVISPWNLPLYLLSWKIAPAIAAGNAVIAKPSEVTPLTSFHLSKLIEEAGFPPGLVNILHGTGQSVGEPLVSHPHVGAISFTGSTATGRAINLAGAKSFKKLSLEMGGKNAALVFADCDLDSTVEGLVKSSFTNQGQVCLCSSRILIEDSLYSAFKERFVEKVEKLKVSEPSQADCDLGALVSATHFEKVSTCVEKALSEGASALCGAKAHSLSKSTGGFYYEPTVLENVKADSFCEQNEIFGPVVSLSSFSSFEDAIERANGTEYGLSATVWSSDSAKVLRASEQLNVGLVWANTWMPRDLRVPFGGEKNSGLGREGGLKALEFFTKEKSICINYRRNDAT